MKVSTRGAIGELRERYTAPHISLFIIRYVLECVDTILHKDKIDGGFLGSSLAGFLAYAWR